MATSSTLKSEKLSGARSLAPERAVAETARHYLDAYGAWVHGHRPARHHALWIERIVDLVEGRTRKRKLLLIAPPGHAKSTWVSLIFPPWYLCNHPTESVLFFTSSDTMARQFGGTVRTTLESNERHTLTFPRADCRPDRDRGWSTDGLYLAGAPAGGKDPSYRALGYGASVVGARAHGIILDDPLTQEQAQSEIEQLKAKRYHDLTIDSRLHPDAWELAIMTRWHEADLASHLAQKPDWDVINMPALGDYPWGHALWPERFPAEWLEAKQVDIGGPLFSCLYLGDPSALGGSVFRSAAWFRPLPTDFDEPGEDGRTPRQRLGVAAFWDLAFSAKDTADYTACVTLGIDRQRRLYILNVLRRRMTPDETVVAMVEHIQTFRPVAVGIEEGAFKQAVTHDVIRRVNQKVLAPVRAIKPAKDKVTRALLPAARGEAGMLFADRDAPWWPTFEAEALGFPLAKHDDQVDALSGATQLLVEATAVQQKPTRVTFGSGGAVPNAWGRGRYR